MQQRIILLDEFLNAQFMNKAVRKLWSVPDGQADKKPPYAELVSDSRRTGAYGVPKEQLDRFIEDRIAIVRAGDPSPMDMRHGDGRIIRSQCTVLPSGGRMLTYNDVDDLVAKAIAEAAVRMSGVGALMRAAERLFISPSVLEGIALESTSVDNRGAE
jgi:hypothetical protein